MKKEIKPFLGTRLHKLRNDRGLSPKEVAQFLEVSVSTYRKWENVRDIRGEPYVKLAKILQVTLSEVLTEEAVESSKIQNEFNDLEELIKNLNKPFIQHFETNYELF